MSEENQQEDQMITLAIEGNPEAFSDLYNRFVTRIFNYIYYRTGSTQDAEDLTAKVFYRAFSHVCSYQQKGIPFSAWLYRIAHNLVANWHRDSSRRKEISIEDSIDMPSRAEHPEAAIQKDQDQEFLIHKLRTLPPERQQLVILKFVEQLSNQEIAVIMGRSEGAIKSLYHRTLLSLRDKLDDSESTADL